MSLSSPVHPLDIPTTLSIRSSRVFDDDYFGGRLTPGSYMVTDPGSRMLLEQTELVYDQLLADRQQKLQRRIEDKKQQFAEKINELQQTDEQKAAEFRRWADAALARLESGCAEEMRFVREDYEMKFARLERSLADQQSSSGASSLSISPN